MPTWAADGAVGYDVARYVDPDPDSARGLPHSTWTSLCSSSACRVYRQMDWRSLAADDYQDGGRSGCRPHRRAYSRPPGRRAPCRAGSQMELWAHRPRWLAQTTTEITAGSKR